MSYRNLEEKLRATGDIVGMLRNAQTPPYIYPVVPPEYSNWRDEQQAWQKSCVFFNQSYHMMEAYLEGPDTVKLLTRLGVNSMASFTPNKAKQYVACNENGHVIGDGVLFHLEANCVSFVGRPPVSNWIEYHAATGEATTSRSNVTSVPSSGSDAVCHRCTACIAFRCRGRWPLT